MSTGADSVKDSPIRFEEMAVLVIASLAILLVQSVVFAAQGLALFAMAGDLGLSPAAIGTAFTCVVLGASAGAPMPIWLLPRIGGRGTVTAGLLTVALAFLLFSAADGRVALYTAAFLAGIGFSLSANTPGVYLIASWSGARTDRAIGIYMMIGMAANAMGPPLVQATMAGIGWKGYDIVVASLAGVLALVAAAVVRDPPAMTANTGNKPDIGPIVRSAPFALMAAATVVTQTCLVTVASVAPAHLATHGLSADLAARLLGIEGLAATVVTGLGGFLTRRLPARRLLTASLVCAGLAMPLFALNQSSPGLLLFALLLGAGIGGATLAVTLLVVEIFGREGSSSLGAIWTLAGLAAIGPWLAGIAAQETGGYGPALIALGAVQWPIALLSLRLRRS